MHRFRNIGAPRVMCGICRLRVDDTSKAREMVIDRENPNGFPVPLRRLIVCEECLRGMDAYRSI